MLSVINDLGSLVLVLAVLRQIRPQSMGFRTLLWPVVIVAVVAFGYVTGLRVTGRDPALMSVGTAIGAVLGFSCAAFTRVWADRGVAKAQAGALAAVLWLIGMAGRFAFVLFAEHGGAATVGQWSKAWHVNSGGWAATLLLMAVTEVLARTGGLVWKRQAALRRNTQANRIPA